MSPTTANKIGPSEDIEVDPLLAALVVGVAFLILSVLMFLKKKVSTNKKLDALNAQMIENQKQQI